MELVDALVVTGSVLNASVRVVYQALTAVELAQRHSQRPGHPLGLKARVHMPAHNLARVRIRDLAEIDELLGRGQIGDVSDPDLLTGVDGDLLIPRLEQFGVPTKPKMAVGGLVMCPPWLHQQPRKAQHVEHGIAPDIQPQLLQRLAQHVVQLARPQPELEQPLLTHRLHQRLRTAHSLRRGLSISVVHLTAQPHAVASPRNTQPFNELLREDLPIGIFRHAPHITS